MASTPSFPLLASYKNPPLLFHYPPKPPPMSSSSPPLSNSSTEALDGLKFGQKIYFEDGIGTLASTNTSLIQAKTTTTTTITTTPSSSSSTKKGRVCNSSTVQGVQPPRCQVEGCKRDLSDGKAYYSRHKVCSLHSKSPTVIVAGLEQRFCQQCSRFHQLPEFDQGKRSCRRRLAGHNERRRKPPPSSLLTSRYARLSSPIIDYGGRGGGGFLMEFASYPKITPRNVLPTPKSSHPVPENQSATLTWQANSEALPDFFLQGSVVGTSFPGPRFPPMDSYAGVTDSSCALSLLSSQTWCPRNMAPTVELNNLFNFNWTPMTQDVAAAHQLPNTSCCFKGIDSANCSDEVVPDIGLGQNPQPPHGNLLGELEVPQHGRRIYMDFGQSRAYESPH